MGSSVADKFVESLYWLNKQDTAHYLQVGTSALELARLSKAQVPILPSAVIGADSFQHFCRSIVWSSPFLSDFPHVSLRLQADQPFQLQAIAGEIAQGFVQTALPSQWVQKNLAELQHLSGHWRLCPSLSVSKPWAKFAPHLMEILPVQYCALANLDSAIKQAWISIYTAQTLLLLQEQAIPIEQLRVGLILQPIEPTQVSGFLRVTETHLHVQATYGLSKSLILGEIWPDTYLYDRHIKRWHRHPGYITSAYQGDGSSSDASTPGALGLEQTILDAPPDSGVLDPTQLEQLLVLAQMLPILNPSLQVVEWSVSKASSAALKVAGLWPAMPLPSLHSSSHPSAAQVQRDSSSLIAAGLAAAVGQATAPLLVCPDTRQLQPHTVANQIVVLKQVVPSDWVWLQQVAGLICTTGSHTSHGAIMARELGLPAVVGVDVALNTFKSGQIVRLDGGQGKIFATSPASSPAQEKLSTPVRLVPQWELQATQLWVNLSQSQRLERALQLPVHGVGLLRSEWFLLDICQGQLPTEWIQHHGVDAFVHHLSHHLQLFLQAWHPRPVLYRSFDHKHEELALMKEGPSQPTHSMLGLRGGAQYMFDSTLFDLELRALARVIRQGYQNIRLILPFIRSVEEFLFCRDRIQAANLQEGLQVWIMAEVPSVLFQLPEYVAAGVQGIAIGTNDLTQLMLGVHRENSYLTQRYTADHPAVIAALSQLVKTAKALGIPCSICGQAPVQHPQMIHQFVEWGVTAISVDASAVLDTQVAIATAEAQLQSKAHSTSTIQNG